MRNVGEGRKLMVIDDDANFRSALRGALERCGFVVEEIEPEGGMKVLDIVRQKAPDAVIIDICMPGLNGFDVLREIRGEAGSPPVMILSGSKHPQSVRKASALGCEVFLEKPFQIDQLVDSLRQIMRPRAGRPVASTSAA